MTPVVEANDNPAGRAGDTVKAVSDPDGFCVSVMVAMATPFFSATEEGEKEKEGASTARTGAKMLSARGRERENTSINTQDSGIIRLYR